MTFNEKIDNFMKKKNYTNLKQLATASNIPYTTLRDFYEKKNADNSRLSTIRKLSKFMECSMDYLAYDEINNPNEINLYGYDIEENKNSDKNFVAKINVDSNKFDEVKTFLKDNDLKYEIDSIEHKNNFDDYALLFSKYKELNDEDKELIANIIETRKKQIDKEIDGE